MDEWQLKEYGSVYTDFIAGCDTSAAARIISRLKYLAEQGNKARDWSKPIKGRDGLFELTVKTKDHEIRIFYCFFPGRKICLLHACYKKSRKIPKEIEIADRNKKLALAEEERRTHNVSVH